MPSQRSLSFWLKTSSDGAESVEQVSPSQVTSLLPRFIPGKRFKSVLKTVEYTRGTSVSQNGSEAEAA